MQQIVFQAFNLIPTMTALENGEILLYVRTHAQQARQPATRIPAQVG